MTFELSWRDKLDKHQKPEPAKPLKSRKSGEKGPDLTPRNGPATTGVAKYRERHSTCCFITSCNKSLLPQSRQSMRRDCAGAHWKRRFFQDPRGPLTVYSEVARPRMTTSRHPCPAVTAYCVSWFTSLHRLPVDTVGIRVRVIELSSMLLHSFPPCFFYCLLLIWPNARPDVRTSGHHALLWSLGSLPHVLLRCS